MSILSLLFRNRFGHPAEWIPFVFSLAAPLLLAPSLIAGLKGLPGHRLLAAGQIVIGALAIVIGIAGMIFHLQSQFFQAFMIKTLVYTAPFIAPLSYAGLGFLLLLNRMVDPKSIEWAHWVVFLALGGFIGNFVLTLCDHAQNGFYYISEWVPVITSAVTIGFLFVAITRKVNSRFFDACLWILAVQVLVGAAGFIFHLTANLQGPSASPMDNFLYGAPLFAPLLFPNLSVLAAIGVWDMKDKCARGTGALAR